MNLLQDKVCIITGAAQGIGKQIAKQFADDGAIVYACDRQDFTSDNDRIRPLVMDVTDAGSVKAVFMQIYKAEGRIDCLVNNAGIVYNRKIGMIVREETERMFLVNVIAVLEMIQLVSRLMARNGGGSIVNIASVTAVSDNDRIRPLVMDVTDAGSVKAVFMQIYKAEGRIDCLVNNAGIVYNRKIGMIVREETERMFLVNVIAVLEMIQLVSRLMARNGGGSIVNIASVTAVLGSPGQVAYSATKGAIISLTKSAAKELAPQGIRVNAVAPGIVKTERFAELYEANGEKIDARIQRIALGRLGTPEDIANACAFLASDRASYISGQILGVDGCASI